MPALHQTVDDLRMHIFLATVTVLWIGGAALIPRAAVAPAMGSLREANFTKDLTPTDDPFLL